MLSGKYRILKTDTI